jgi:hypothetical protein
MKQLKVIIESTIPQEFFQIFASIGYWNMHGERVVRENKAGTLGSAATQKDARTQTYEDFVMGCLLIDIQTTLQKHPQFKSGKSGSHIWVSNEQNKRMLLIHF